MQVSYEMTASAFLEGSASPTLTESVNALIIMLRGIESSMRIPGQNYQRLLVDGPLDNLKAIFLAGNETYQQLRTFFNICDTSEVKIEISRMIGTRPIEVRLTLTFWRYSYTPSLFEAKFFLNASDGRAKPCKTKG